MAPKKALHPPPSPEPEEQEETSEEESGESEEGEESEEESEVEEKERHKEKTTQIQPTQVNKKSGGQKQTTPPPSAPQSEEEEEDDEEEGSESEEDGGGEEGVESDSPPSPNVSDFTIKPISPAKPVSKDAKPTAKRSVDAQKDDEKDSRNRKKAKSNEGEEKKEKASAVSVSASGGAGRVWSEEDEIAVLQGMIDYQNKKGADPSNDMAAFHEFVKGKLRADISKTQLYEKVRRFKKKFFTNMEKAASSGEVPTFSKNHESIAFELSKKIWGGGAQSNGGVVDALKGKKVGKIGSVGGIFKEGEKKGGAKVGSISGMVKEDEKDDVVMDDVRENEGDFQSKYQHLSQSFDLDGSSLFSDGVRRYLKENLNLIDSVKARELDEKWKKLREQEAEFFLRRMTLMTEQTKLVLDARKKR